MARRMDDEDQPHWVLKFVKGAVAAAVVCGVVLAVVSLYVLPPAKMQPLPPAEKGPKLIDGIEVSSQPAQPAAPGSGAETGTETAGQAGAGATGADVPATGAGTGAETTTGTSAGVSTETATGTTTETATGTATSARPGGIAVKPEFPDGPALTVNAAAFTAPEGKPLIAVVLDDTAADPLLLQQIFAAKVPLTIGVVAGQAGDREVATEARNAGFEVVAELPFAMAGQHWADPLDLKMSRDAAQAGANRLIGRLPEALAASLPMAVRGLPSPDALKGLSDVLAPHGFGFLDKGVKEGESSVLKLMGLGMPVAVSHFAIPADAKAADIVATLDKAAKDTGPTGGAVIMAVPTQTLLQALQLWGGPGSVAAGALAPLSAVIARQGAS